MSTRLTVITPSYQQAAYLPECLASVREQPRPVEHIVVDGGSTDGSRAILEAHNDQLAWWCSEKDKGQSDALNKGIARATGDAFTWVNSDDLLTPGAATHVAEAFDSDPRLLMFGGHILHRTGTSDKLFDAINDAGDTRRLYRDPIINQPATWYRASAVKELGGVETRLHFVMDVELWWQLLFRHGTDHLRFERIPLAVFRFHDESKTVSQHARFLRELAELLFHLCQRTGNTALADALAIGYPERMALRELPAGKEHAERVAGMTIHFLLKWHGHVHNEREFSMMKHLATHRLVDEGDLLPPLGARWPTTREKVEVRSWTTYRMRRKLKSWFA